MTNASAFVILSEAKDLISSLITLISPRDLRFDCEIPRSARNYRAAGSVLLMK